MSTCRGKEQEEPKVTLYEWGNQWKTKTEDEEGGVGMIDEGAMHKKCCESKLKVSLREEAKTPVLLFSHCLTKFI